MSRSLGWWGWMSGLGKVSFLFMLGEFRKVLGEVLRVGDRGDRMDRMGNSKVGLGRGKDSGVEDQGGSRLRSRSKSPINDKN
jgi:hypothetical protein